MCYFTLFWFRLDEKHADIASKHPASYLKLQNQSAIQSAQPVYQAMYAIDQILLLPSINLYLNPPTFFQRPGENIVPVLF